MLYPLSYGARPTSHTTFAHHHIPYRSRPSTSLKLLWIFGSGGHPEVAESPHPASVGLATPI